MEIKTKDQAISLIYSSMPYPQHITDLDSVSKDQEIRFTWRRTNRFMFNYTTMSVWEIGNGVIVGSNISILVEKLFKQNAIITALNE